MLPLFWRIHPLEDGIADDVVTQILGGNDNSRGVKEEKSAQEDSWGEMNLRPKLRLQLFWVLLFKSIPVDAGAHGFVVSIGAVVKSGIPTDELDISAHANLEKY